MPHESELAMILAALFLGVFVVFLLAVFIREMRRAYRLSRQDRDLLGPLNIRCAGRASARKDVAI